MCMLGSRISTSASVSMLPAVTSQATFRFNADSLGLLCEQLGGKALDIENDLSNIFLNAGDSRELVLYAVDLYRQYGHTGKRGEQHTT